jgi:DNA ligase (NAD+)
MPELELERHRKLVEEIRAHDHRYYVLDDPQISDRAYDAPYAELRELERAHPELVSDASPTQRVGAAPRDELRRVPHAAPMLSLDKAIIDEAGRAQLIRDKTAPAAGA